MPKKKAVKKVEKEVAVFDVEKVQEKLKNIKSLSDLTGSNGVIQEMIKQTVERILNGEQEAHLGYEPYKKSDKSHENSRNGYSSKTLKTSSGEVEIEIPRDRKGTFEPQFIAKHQSFDPDLERRVTSMYARGMSVRDIQAQLEEFYGTEVSGTLISKITDKVLEGVQAWQGRPHRGCLCRSFHGRNPLQDPTGLQSYLQGSLYLHGDQFREEGRRSRDLDC
jgi:transposase-like protein